MSAKEKNPFMMKRYVSALCAVVVAVLMPAALAESTIPTTPLEPDLRHASGSLRVGYTTNYSFRGLIPDGYNPAMPISLDWRSDLNEDYSFIMSAKETVFIGNSSFDMENEITADFGIQRRINKTTYAALSARVTDGGLSGLAAGRLYGEKGTTAELGLLARQDLSFLPGFYAQVGAAYSMYGIKGWWFDASIGSNNRITENLYMGFQFGATMDSSYWPSGGNGWQSLFFRVAADYHLIGNLYLEPYIGIHWLGKGGHRLNHTYGDRLLQGNAWVAGVMLHFPF